MSVKRVILKVEMQLSIDLQPAAPKEGQSTSSLKAYLKRFMSTSAASIGDFISVVAAISFFTTVIDAPI
jgi:hypothetical protein